MKQFALLISLLFTISILFGCGTEELSNSEQAPKKEDVVVKETPETEVQDSGKDTGER